MKSAQGSSGPEAWVPTVPSRVAGHSTRQGRRPSPGPAPLTQSGRPFRRGVQPWVGEQGGSRGRGTQTVPGCPATTAKAFALVPSLLPPPPPCGSKELAHTKIELKGKISSQGDGAALGGFWSLSTVP